MYVLDSGISFIFADDIYHTEVGNTLFIEISKP